MTKLFKRMLSVMCMVTILCTLCPLSLPSASAETSGDFTYIINDDGVSVTLVKYTGSAADVIIPDTLGGCPVTMVGGWSFANCATLQNVTIPDGVTLIGGYAFIDCTALQSIIIPESVTLLDCGALSGCTSLQSITLPDSVTFIGGDAFYNTAYYNTPANWEQQVLYIGNHLIAARADMRGNCVIKDGVKTIANSAFYYCTSIKSITIPESVTKIGWSAFAYCTSLQSITIPEGVTDIEWSVFAGCESLESIIIPDSVTDVQDWAFDGCIALEDVYYRGNQASWDVIKCGEGNAAFTEARIHFEGNINADEVIDIADATLLFRAANGRIILKSEEAALADVNSDGVINIADATMLFRYANGRITSLG